MNTEYDDELNDELREEYDFSRMIGGVHGKYARQYHEGVKLIMLEPDVAKKIPDAKSVNETLIECYQKSFNNTKKLPDVVPRRPPAVALFSLRKQRVPPGVSGSMLKTR